MAHPPHNPQRHSIIARFRRIKKWHVHHRDDHPLEYQIWDAMLTLWLMGWIAWLPAMVLDTPWALPLCFLGMMAPGLYVGWRRQAHNTGRLRCDWLDQAS